MFLKTHKTASSSVTSILNRFVDTNNLEMALPHGAEHRFFWPEPFRARTVDLSRLRNGKADFLCNHAVFSSRSEFQKVLHPHTKYITILRDPVERFESMFYFEGFHKLYPNNATQNPLLSFVDSIDDKHLKDNMTLQQLIQFPLLVRNGMIFDLTSYVSQDIPTGEQFDTHINQVAETFDFVLLAEYFDEGLVLLRKFFNWSFLDLVYQRKNTRRIRHQELLTAEVRKKVGWLNKGDIDLYNHFKTLFHKRIEIYGEEFERDLEIFRVLNGNMNIQCKQSDSIVSKADMKYAMEEIYVTRREMEMIGDLENIPNCFCTKLWRGEIQYVEYFKNKFLPYHFLMDNEEDRETDLGC